MISFYPGPSKVYPEVRQYLADAFDAGYLGIPHRGDTFTHLTRGTVELLRKKLNIPQDYYIFFASSATECWEILTQSLVVNKSLHIYNGSFGEKWLDYARRLHPGSSGYRFGVNDELDVAQLAVTPDTDLICLTQNETSNGTQLSNGAILNVQSRFKDKLVAVDATSSMAGINLKFIRADVWFASVQKCFGMTPGLAVMVCSPRAIFRAKQINEKNHYNSLVSMYEKMLNYQTTHTPNILAIYTLRRILDQRPLIKTVDFHLVNRARELYEFFAQFTQFQFLVENENVRSHTVLALEAEPRVVEDIKRNARENGLLLGNGYGEWAKNTFRIANFPAHTAEDFLRLKNFFQEYYG